MPKGLFCPSVLPEAGNYDSLAIAPSAERLADVPAPQVGIVVLVSDWRRSALRIQSDSQLTLSDIDTESGKMSPGATIAAGALPVSGSRLAVRVGSSCLQWHGYRGHALYLISAGRRANHLVDAVGTSE